jgi:phosphodiesterase/alkaline phosphatase D-like protein
MGRHIRDNFVLVVLCSFLVACGGGGGGDSPPPGQGSQPPIVTTDPAKNINATTADLHCTINVNGTQTSYHFEWSTDPDLANSLKTPGLTASANAYTYGVHIENLTPSTKYYYRAVAGNSAGISYGGIHSFITAAPGGPPTYGPPTVQTLPATEVTQTRATVSAKINPNGLETSYYVEWAKDNTFIGALRIPTAILGTVESTVTIPLSGFSSSTQYFFRAVAANSSGTTQGGILSFTTLAPANPWPTVQTLNANPIGQNSATLNGLVNPNGLPTTVYFLWGTDNNLAGASKTPDQTVGFANVITGDVWKSAAISGLAASTTYYFQMVATNSAGTGRGVIASFTTQPLSGLPPAVQTFGSTFVGTNDASLNGSVNPNGLLTTTYFEWGTNSQLTGATQTQSVSMGSGTTVANFVLTISNLVPSTTYYYRAVATNSAGTNYGAIESLTTDASTGSLPEAFAYYADSVTENSMRLMGGARSSNLSATAYFEYSTDPSFVGALRTPDQPITPGLAGTNISAIITGLSPSTYYYYRVVATNSAGTSYSGTTYLNPPVGINVMSTLTAAGWPVAITRTDEAVGSITSNSIRVNGFFSSTSLPATVYFEYGSSVNFAVALKTPDQIINPTSSANVIASITGLSPATDYYYRAVATNANGKSIGMIIIFRTLP